MRTLFTLLVLFLLTGCGSQHSVVVPDSDLKQAKSAFGDIPESQSIHLDNKDGRIFITLELEALKKALAWLTT